MTGFVAGDTALRWYVYLLVLAFGVWGLSVLVLIAGGVGCRARRVMSAPTSDDTDPFTRAPRTVEDLLERGVAAMSGRVASADLHRLVSKDIRPLAKKALRAGWRLERIGHARSAHGVKLVSGDGGTEVPLRGRPVTPICPGHFPL